MKKFLRKKKRKSGFPDKPDRELVNEVKNHLQHGRRIEAIKLYMRRMNVGLKQGKDAVDAIAREL